MTMMHIPINPLMDTGYGNIAGMHYGHFGKGKGKGKGTGGKTLNNETGQQDDQKFIEKRLKLYVGGLPNECTDNNVQDHFRRYGPIEAFQVIRPPGFKNPYCFITYKFANDCDAAAIDGDKNFPGAVKQLSIKYCQEREVSKGECKEIERYPFLNASEPAKLFVGGIYDYHDERELGDFFSQWGMVLIVDKVMDMQTGKSKGFAFVQFATKEGAIRLMSDVPDKVQFRGHVLDIKSSGSSKAPPMADDRRLDLTIRALNRHFIKRGLPTIPGPGAVPVAEEAFYADQYPGTIIPGMLPAQALVGAEATFAPQYAQTGELQYSVTGAPGTAYAQAEFAGYQQAYPSGTEGTTTSTTTTAGTSWAEPAVAAATAAAAATPSSPAQIASPPPPPPPAEPSYGTGFGAEAEYAQTITQYVNQYGQPCDQHGNLLPAMRVDQYGRPVDEQGRLLLSPSQMPASDPTTGAYGQQQDYYAQQPAYGASATANGAAGRYAPY